MYHLKKRLALYLILTMTGCLFLIGSVGRVEATVQMSFYVDPVNGSDTNPGTQGSPFRTIEKARSEVALINGNMTGDIYVYLMSGTYKLANPLSFGPADSGTNGYTVYYKAYTNQVPVISGGESLPSSGWSLYDSTKSIYRFSTAGLADFRQIYVNDSLAIRARYPNMDNSETNTFGPYKKTIGANVDDKYVLVNNADLPAMPANLSKVEMVLHPHWYHENLRIASLEADPNDAARSRLNISAPENYYGLNTDKKNAFYTGASYYLENDLSFLDAEGEWYLDTSSDWLYYKPRTGENINNVSVIVPQLEHLVTITGTSANPVNHLDFSWISFKYTNWTWPDNNGLVATQGFQPMPTGTTPSTGAVEVQYANNLVFANNLFKNTAGNGLQFVKGVKNSRIVKNNFTQVGANGIYLDSSNDRYALLPERTENILIGNNSFTFPGRIVHNGMGIMASWVNNTTIEHNEINNAPYMGIQVGNQPLTRSESIAGYNIIRHNKINDVMKLLDDGGGVYTLARQYGTQIYKNYIYNVTKGEYAMNAPIAGIYHDNCSEYMTDESNVLSGVQQDIFLQMASHCPAQNIIQLNNTSSDTAVQNSAGKLAVYREPVKIQEDDFFDLVGYTVETNTNNMYSNYKGLMTTSSGSASYRFKGSSDTYHIRVAYVEENDGNPNYKLYVNGLEKYAWTSDLAAWGLTNEFTQKVFDDIVLNYNDVIEVKGTLNGGALARLDFVEIYK